ncbi:MAG: MBL fold metallo-hydrolase RNA specificity domain-containing protein [Marmoricola sp.]
MRSDISSDAFARLNNLHMVRSSQDSRALTDRRRSSHIVVSSSGMASGGRVLHHLKEMLPDPRNTIVMTGYQGIGTRGRSLVEGADHVKIFGELVPVHAEIVSDNEFSVHADAADLDTWLAGLDPAPKTVFVTHGEPRSALALATRVRRNLGVEAVVPAYGDEVELSGGAASLPGVSLAGISAAGVSAAGVVPQPGAAVTSDLRVREADAHHVVLEGTITINLD